MPQSAVAPVPSAEPKGYCAPPALAELIRDLYLGEKSGVLTIQRFKESMTQMVVHDLKNPLAGIMGNIQLMQIQRTQMNEARLEELLSRTQESSRQLMRMILNILDIGKLEERKMPLRLEEASLHQIVQENVGELTSLSARDGIHVENRVGVDLPKLRVDRELVGRVVANLQFIEQLQT